MTCRLWMLQVLNSPKFSFTQTPCFSPRNNFPSLQLVRSAAVFRSGSSAGSSSSGFSSSSARGSWPRRRKARRAKSCEGSGGGGGWRSLLFGIDRTLRSGPLALLLGARSYYVRRNTPTSALTTVWVAPMSFQIAPGSLASAWDC